jgi:hypothetical protein
MYLDLTVEAAALAQELHDSVEHDRYRFSCGIRTMREIIRQGQARAGARTLAAAEGVCAADEREIRPEARVVKSGDFAMTDIHSLDADTLCAMLVGKFLQKWASMEEAMHTAMQTALGLDTFQSAIVSSNTQLRDKIHILQTLVSMLPFEEEIRAQFDKTLKAIGKASGNRNMMAHVAFAPSPDGRGVSFSVTKAKRGPPSFPETIWDIGRFETEYAAIEGLEAGVVAITEAFNQKQVIEKMRETARAHPAALYYYSSGGGVWLGERGFVQGTPRPMLDSLGSDTDVPASKIDDQNSPAG